MQEESSQFRGDHIIIDPSGTDVGPNSVTLTDQITFEASE
jgi:hypothetical protein